MARRSHKNGKKSSSPSGIKKLWKSYKTGLALAAGLVVFSFIAISSLLILQHNPSAENSEAPTVSKSATEYSSPYQVDPAEADKGPANKPHPINLGDVAVTDTLLQDGDEYEGDTAELPPSVTSSDRARIQDTKSADDLGAKIDAPEVELASLPPTESLPEPGEEPTFRRPAKPMIAVVLDDVGVNRRNAELAIELPPSVTLSFMTYAPGVSEMAQRAAERGHELMLHLPMEPEGPADPGPKALLTSLDEEELLARLEWGLTQFDGYVGVNNHMGSKFTAWDRGMHLVLRRIKQRGVFFLDSRTNPDSVVTARALALQLPVLSRDVFIDNDYEDGDKILRQLRKAEVIAKNNGHAIAIGHPHPKTVEVLWRWLAEAEERGFQVVPVTRIMKLKNGPA